MSLTDYLTRRTLCVHLAPHQLNYALRQGGRMVAGSAAGIGFDNPDGHWAAPLAALRDYLRQPGRAGAGWPLAISLASRWCRMSVAPWSDALLSEAGAARFLQGQLAALYGEGARAWSIVGDDAPYGQPRLACGIDADLLQALRDTAAEHGHACHAVEPVLSVAWRAIAVDKPRAFALVEPGRLAIAAVAGGRIVALQSQPCPDDWHAELARAWQRWTLRAPELAAIDRVAVVDLSGAPAAALEPGFSYAAAAMAQLGAPQLMGESAWA